MDPWLNLHLVLEQLLVLLRLWTSNPYDSTKNPFYYCDDLLQYLKKSGDAYVNLPNLLVHAGNL